MITKPKNRKIWNEYLDFLMYDKKMKENTLLSYKRDSSLFFDFCMENGVDTFEDSCELFNPYMENLRNQGKSATTISRKLASLRSFFRFLKDRSYIAHNPTHGVKYEKNILPKEETQTLTVDEIDRLINATKGEGFKAIRDEAIIETLYACGLKVSELINLKKEDLFLKDGYIKVKSGKTSRYVPIYKGAIKAIKIYIEEGRPLISPTKRNTFLFLNRDCKQITRQGLWKILKSYGEKAGIEKEITPHLIRRSMAVHLIEGGADFFDVKDILGHKNVNLTKNYVKEFKPSVISAYVKAHPKA